MPKLDKLENGEINLHGLMFLAKKARERAYCPYSGVSVGAALLLESGEVYLGANVENASYPAGICAERVAMSCALTGSDSSARPIAIAVCGGRAREKSRDSFSPCGICRQVMAEHCDGEFKIILEGKEEGFLNTYTLRELLPYGFDKEKL